MNTQTCQVCNWTNVGCLNVGEFGHPKWICHGCIARAIKELVRLADKLDAVYNFNEAARAAVILCYGLHHSQLVQQLRESEPQPASTPSATVEPTDPPGAGTPPSTPAQP